MKHVRLELTAGGREAEIHLMRETEWEPAYPTYCDGLQQVVETWVNDGTVTETADGYAWNGS